ncbi:WcaI family glycosyltransferase [Tateyamaria armeniaca]|uniref:WcaI family glycosyltransferase n=1 Tax=Tateyamaria armeniaca TaxID=2518930 RepID=A0ABW8UYN7_9RHOB
MPRNPTTRLGKFSDGYPLFRYKTRRLNDQLSITHCPHYVPARPTGIRRILHHTSFAVTAIFPALWHSLRHRPDLVVVVAPSLISAPIGYLAALLCGARKWLHVQDFEVEAAFATGLLKDSGFFSRAASGFERWCLTRFDLVTTISKPMLVKLVEKGVDPERVYEFRNWADLEAVSPLDGPSPLKQELGINAKHVILYSGNIANKQGLEIIPEAAQILKSRKDIMFAVFGDGPALKTLKEKSSGLENVAFYPLQPKARLSDLMGIADIHVLPQLSGAADLVLPSKLTNMLASGKPVVATADAGTALADEVLGSGLITLPGDANALAEAVVRLIDDPTQREKFGKQARHTAIERWDKQQILSGLLARLHVLTERQESP